MAFDFPSNPVVDQVYTSADGVNFAWDGQAWMKGSGSGTTGGGADYVLKTGDTMTGHLTLNADPTLPLHAATKDYVDGGALPPAGLDGQAIVAKVGVPVWGAPINGGDF